MKIGIHLHLFYIDQLKEFKKNISLFKGLDYKLIVTTSKGNKAKIQKAFKEAEVYVVEKRGWDVAPFILALNKLEKHDPDVVLKIHSKGNKRSKISLTLPNKSRFRNANDWREKQLKSLIGSKKNIKNILHHFSRADFIGMIGSYEFLTKKPKEVKFKTQYKRNRTLLGTKFKLSRKEIPFFAGTMFWIRWEVAKLLIKRLDFYDFEMLNEKNFRTNDSLAHVFEHHINNIVHNNCLNNFIYTIEELEGNMKEILRIKINRIIFSNLFLIRKFIINYKVTKKNHFILKVFKIPVLYFKLKKREKK